MPHSPRLLLAGLCLLAPLLCAQAAPPDAQAIMASVVARLPHEPLDIVGDFIVRKQRGVVAQELRFAMRLEWGATPPIAQYSIRDAFGTELERLNLSRRPDGSLDATYTAAGAPAPVPALTARIQGTDLSWTDLALDFLWWPGGKVTGSGSVRGRDCHIIQVPAPAHTAPPAGDDRAERYAFVRLWIDRELFVLMRAEAYNAADVRVRRLWVHSLKKQQDRWMIKDLEIQAYPPVQRTRLRVRAVAGDSPAEPAQAPEFGASSTSDSL